MNISVVLGAQDTLGGQEQGVPGLAVQPYEYCRREMVEPDWRRFPGWRDVSGGEWESAQWQRSHSVKNLRELRSVFGDLVEDSFYADLQRDQEHFATMPLLLPPQVINTMVPQGPPDLASLYADPVRRYMLPVATDRNPQWSSHPFAIRDSLHEGEMWAVEGLTHRYPTKALAELVTTCPQYCGHCTRMDLVGTSTPQVVKTRFQAKPASRMETMLEYLRRTPGIRDVVVSGGDVANLPWHVLEGFVNRLLEIGSIRDIRLASKSLVALPQHWIQPDLVAGVERVSRRARSRNVQLAVHTHANTMNSITPLVATAAKGILEAGVRDVRNQGVLLRGVNDGITPMLDLCFSLLDGAAILPYYFYMCDMIPHAEHWRVALWEVQALQDAIAGYLPGFATPRIVCDVPYLGKRWVHQVSHYDRELGVSHWTKNYLTGIETTQARGQRYQYYDPIPTLPESGQAWWSRHTRVLGPDGQGYRAPDRAGALR